MGLPCIRYSSVSVPAGTKISPPEFDLKNPTNDPWLIDEIRFRVASSTGMSSVRCRFTLGGFEVSDYVHLFNFAPVVDFTPQDSDPALLTISPLRTATWRPPYPIYVPAGWYLAPEFFNSDEHGGGGTETVRVTYVGRTSDRIQTSLRLPWVCSFVGNRVAGNADGTDKSVPADIRNPFAVPLKLRYMIGRSYHTLSTEGARLADLEYGRIRIADSKAQSIVRDPVPLGHVMNVTTSAWFTRDTYMPARTYYIASVDAKFTNINEGGGALFWRPYISLVGDREVSI